MGRDDGVDVSRVAEVIVSLAGGGGRRGSGYLATTGKVLTAAHVVAGASRLTVRFDADRPGELAAEAVVEWAHAGIDVAVLTVPQSHEADRVGFGRVAEHDAVLHCSAVGFPQFKLRTDVDGSRFRDSEHVHATCAVLSNRREGTLDLSVTPPTVNLSMETSPWEGMSGAVVLSGGRIVGVIAEHHLSDGPGRLAASRVDRWAEQLNAAERDQLETVLGCSLARLDLPDVLPPSGIGLMEAAYEAQLRDIAPERLIGRGAELCQLVEFCAGAEPYLWLQGPPWAGKTALAAWFALHPPGGVVPVWFFITARFAGQADSTAYTEAIVQQLATIAGREPSGYASPIARDGERRLLLTKAAERVSTLLLIVDGLDEDQSAEPGGSGPSVASLLPERLPPNVRVLVTSRPGPGVPQDVTGGHPLRHCRMLRLNPAAAARHTEHEARYDLSAALSGDELSRDLVGLLAAARGSLRVKDLKELSRRPHYELKKRLGSVFGRVLRVRGNSAGYSNRSEDRGYLFAHETLLAAAVDELGPDVEPYRERIHAWAQHHASKGWPQNTPSYLLQSYGRLVASLSDVRRATALATDNRRLNCMRQATGSDAAGLAEVDAARRAVWRATPRELAALAALAASADLVARRNGSLHPGVPVALARLGDTRRAVGLARSVFHCIDRARAMAGVSQVLAETGNQLALSLAREAVGLAEAAEEEAPWDIQDEANEVIYAAAVALMTAAQEDEALAVLRSREQMGWVRWPQSDTLSRFHSFRQENSLSWVRALAKVAVAAHARNAGRAAELLSEAEEAAERLSRPAHRIRALAAVAEACKATATARATRLYDRLIQLADEGPEESTSVPSAAATALRESRPHDASTFAHLAARRVAEGLQHPVSESDIDAVTDAVCALADVGAVDEAHHLMKSIQVPPNWRDVFTTVVWSALAVAEAREGRVDAAWQHVKIAWNAAGAVQPSRERPFAATEAEVKALAARSSARELESNILAMEPSSWVFAGALASAAEYLADHDRDHARRLLEKAALAVTRSSREVVDPNQDQALADLAGGLAAIGELADAERLITVIGAPDIHTWALAAAAAAFAGTDRPDALRLAQAAARGAEEFEDWFWGATLATGAAQALAHVEEQDQALAVAEAIPDRLRNSFGPEVRITALTAVAAELWQHDPLAAAALCDRVEERILSEGTHSGLALPLARLLTAVGQRDPERSGRLQEFLCRLPVGSPEGVASSHQALMTLLTAGADPEGAKRWLAAANEALRHASEPLNSDEQGCVAIVYAALGDYVAVEHLTESISNVSERAEVLSTVAAYLAGVRSEFLTVRPLGRKVTTLHVARRLASLLLPPNSTNSAEFARQFLAKALMGDGWHHAIPVLAELEPEAVGRLRDVVFAHLGLEDQSTASVE